MATVYNMTAPAWTDALMDTTEHIANNDVMLPVNDVKCRQVIALTASLGHSGTLVNIAVALTVSLLVTAH